MYSSRQFLDAFAGVAQGAEHTAIRQVDRNMEGAGPGRANFSSLPGALDAFWLLPDQQTPDPNNAVRWQELESYFFFFGIRFSAGVTFFRSIFLTSLIFVNSFGLLFIKARISLELCRCFIACCLSFLRSLALRCFTSASSKAPTWNPMATISLNTHWRLDHEENVGTLLFCFREIRMDEIGCSGCVVMRSSTS